MELRIYITRDKTRGAYSNYDFWHGKPDWIAKLRVWIAGDEVTWFAEACPKKFESLYPRWTLLPGEIRVIFGPMRTRKLRAKT